MRNLKKVLSLALALVMLLGMMVVGAGAATSFKDADEIQNKEAVAVLVGMGIMKGREDGTNFEPAGTLTRAEAALMIAQLDLGVDAAAALVGNGTSTFSDVPTTYWAAGAIDYCVEQGYIAGDGNGHFYPTRNVSSVEFGSMALRLLGYDAKNEGLVGDQWAVKAAALIRKAGLATSVAANTQAMTRDAMAQMAFNTLTAETVEYNGLNIDSPNLTVNSPASVRRHTGSNVTGTNKTYDGKVIQSSITPIRFCEERFPTLKLDRSGENEFKEAYSVWTYRGVEITDSKIALNCISTTQKETKDDNSWMTNVKKLASGFVAYLNGKNITASVTNISYITNTLTKNGRLVEVYVNPDDLSEVEKVVAIDTTLGEVTKVNSTDEKITIKLVESDVTNSTPSLVTDKGYGEFKVGDLVLVQGTNNGDANAKFFKTASDGTKVISVTAPQKVEGFATTRHNNTDGTGKSIVMSGETYLAAYGQEKDTVKNFELSTSEDSTLYLDQYGYIMKAVGAKGYTAPADKLIAVSDVYQTLESGKLATKVEGMLSDGTIVKWTWKGTEPDEGYIYTYVKDTNDGKYTLTRVKANVPTTTNSYVADVDKAFVFKASDSRGQGNGSNLFYSDDVLFIFVEPDGTITKATGVQSYDNNGEKIPVVAQALRLEQGTDDHIEIRAVFIQAEPDVVDVNDIIYVHEANANKNQVVEQKDGTNKVRYGYEAYNANAELIEEFLGDAKNQSTYFIKKELNEDGSYVMNETNKFVFNQKYVASANGTSGNAFTLVVEKDNEWVDLVRSSNTKVLDVSDDGLDIENISELNKAVNEGRLVTVSVIWTRTYSDGTYDAKAVFVTDVGAIGSYNSTVIGSDPREGSEQPGADGAYTVESKTQGATKALSFYLLTKAAQDAGTAVPTTAAEVETLVGDKWTSSVKGASKDDVVIVKAAGKLATSTGIQATNILDATTLNQATSVSPTEIGAANSGYWKLTMGEQSLIIKDVAVTAATIGKMSIAPNGEQVNFTMANGTFANNTEKCKAVVEYINNNVDGWTAELGATNAAGEVGEIKITNKLGTSTRTASELVVSTTEIVVDGTSYVMKAAAGTLKLGEALEMAGINITGAGANVFVITNTGTVGNYGTASAITAMDTDDLAGDAVTASAKEIVTNGGKGFAQMAGSNAYAATGATGVGQADNSLTWTGVVKANQGMINDGSNDYLPIGEDVILVLTPGKAILEANNANGITFSADTTNSTGLTTHYTVTTDGYAAGAHAATVTAEVTINIGSVSALACKVVLTPAAKPAAGG